MSSSQSKRIIKLPPKPVVTSSSGQILSVSRGECYIGYFDGCHYVLPNVDSDEYLSIDPDFYIDPKLLPDDERRYQILQGKTSRKRFENDESIDIKEKLSAYVEQEVVMDMSGSKGTIYVKNDFRTDTSKFSLPLPQCTDSPDEVRHINYDALLPTISEEIQISCYDDEVDGNVFMMAPITNDDVIEMPFCLCPVALYSRRAFIGADWKVFINTDETLYVGDYQDPPRTAMETNALMLRCFSAAAACNDIPTLYRFFAKVKVCAGLCGLWSELGHALDKFSIYLESCDWDHIGKKHDLIYFAVEAGEAHDAAYHRGEEDSMKPAILSYKRAAMASINGKWPIGRDYAGHAWCCYGLALKRAGEYVMSCRAYQLALLYTTPQHSINVTIYVNMKSLCECMYKSTGHSGEVTSVLSVPATQSVLTPCGNCKIMCKSPKLCGGCLCLSYCSVFCQRSDWMRHKKECKKRRVVVTKPDSK